MPRRQRPIREYIYVSTRKMNALALSENLPSRIAKRVTGLNLSTALLGFGVSLAEAPAQGVLSLLADIDVELHKRYQVRAFDDPDMRSGHWFEAENLPMIFGVQDVDVGTPGFADETRAADGSEDRAAVFIYQKDEERSFELMLGGSVDHLVDRKVQRADASQSMSDPSALSDIIRAALKETSQRGDSGSGMPEDERDRYAIDNLAISLRQVGLTPLNLNFLARAVRVPAATSRGERSIVGTPLWVAYAVPP